MDEKMKTYFIEWDYTQRQEVLASGMVRARVMACSEEEAIECLRSHVESQEGGVMDRRSIEDTNPQVLFYDEIEHGCEFIYGAPLDLKDDPDVSEEE